MSTRQQLRNRIIFIIFFMMNISVLLKSENSDIIQDDSIDSAPNTLLEMRAGNSYCPLDGLTEKLLADLLDVVKAKYNPELTQIRNLDADITYMFADMKWDGKNLKILEFGQGKQGGYRTYDGVWQVGKIWAGFWRYLSSFKLPIWFVCAAMDDRPMNKLGITSKQRFAWPVAKMLGVEHKKTLSDVIRSPMFINRRKSKTITRSDDLSTYKGIIVYRYRDDRIPSCLRNVENFRKIYPGFIVIDRVCRPYAASKSLANVLFQDEELQKYRPRTMTYKKVPARGESITDLRIRVRRQIRKDFPNTSMFVVKPLNSGMSNGVVVIKRTQLKRALRLIIRPITNKNSYTFNYRPSDTVTWR